MLVHKRTLGVLEYIWTGLYTINPKTGEEEPLPRRAERQDLLDAGEDPADWWELSGPPGLLNVLRHNAPLIVPELDADGNLVGAKPLWQLERQKAQEAVRAKAREENQARGYKSRVNLRPKGMMPFLRQQTPPAGES